MRLHVGVGRAKEALGAFDGEALGDVDELAAAVIALTRVALGVLIGEHRALNLENGARHKVFARNHLESVALTAQLTREHGGNLGINNVERIGHE
jgi:hypothetical protein